MQLTVNTANIHADIMAAESWACCSKKKKTIEESIFIILYKWTTLYDSGAQMVCHEASYYNLLL